MTSNTRTYVVTGAARGLGAAYVRQLTAGGGQVLGVDLQWDAPAPEGCIAMSLDLTEAGAAEAVFETALARLGQVEGLVSNAGAVAPGPLAEVSDLDWTRVVEINMAVTFRLMRAAARSWGAVADPSRHAFRLVNTTSGAGLHGAPNHAPYVAAKAAVAALTVAAARELRGIAGVNAVAPIARTGLIPDGSALAQAMCDPVSGAPWEAADVAPVVAYLAGRECAFTGSVLGVHGGVVTEYVGWQGAREFQAPPGGWTAPGLSDAFADFKPVRPARTQLELLNRR